MELLSIFPSALYVMVTKQLNDHPVFTMITNTTLVQSFIWSHFDNCVCCSLMWLNPSTQCPDLWNTRGQDSAWRTLTHTGFTTWFWGWEPLAYCWNQNKPLVATKASRGEQHCDLCKILRSRSPDVGVLAEPGRAWVTAGSGFKVVPERRMPWVAGAGQDIQRMLTDHVGVSPCGRFWVWFQCGKY